MQQVGCAVIAQNPRLVPGDGRLTSLREATGTVANRDLIAASVMSKALAGGAQALALEVTWGEGAACTSLEEARRTAELMAWLASGWDRDVRTIVTAIREPLGRMIGNALEVREAAEVLRGGGPGDLRRVATRIAGELAEAAGVVPAGEGAARAEAALADGSALVGGRRLGRGPGRQPGGLDGAECACDRARSVCP